MAFGLRPCYLLAQARRGYLLKRIRQLLLCAAIVAGSAFVVVPHASACTGDVCDGICNFMNDNPKIFKNGCTIR